MLQSWILGTVAVICFLHAADGHEKLSIGIKCDPNSNFTDIHGDTHVHLCNTCMFPNDCILNNTCRKPSTGAMCERCLEKHEVTLDEYGDPLEHNGFHRVGSRCIECMMIPWGAIGLGTLLVIVLIPSVCKGFTTSIGIKVRLLVHYLQLLALSLSLRVYWSNVTMQFLQYTMLSYVNTATVNLNCYIQFEFGNHFLDLISSMGLPLATFLIVALIDKTMRKTITLAGSDKSKQRVWHLRSLMRRISYTLLVIWYCPVVVNTLRTFACSNTVPVLMVFDHTRDVYLYDHRQSCGTFIFQTFNFVGTIFLIGFGVVFPIGLIFFTLRLRKWNLLKKKLPLHGGIYEAYRRNMCFWEALPMLRKFVYALMTDVYPFHPLVQVCCHLSTSVIYLIAVILGRPYRRVSWQSEASILNVHMLFEVVSNLSIILLQIEGLLMILEIEHVAIELTVLVSVAVVLFIWLMMMASVGCEHETEQQLEIAEVPEPVGKPQEEKLEFWQRNSDGEGVSIVEIKERKDNVNF